MDPAAATLPGRCPNCQTSEGPVGTACTQAGCSRKSYHLVPIELVPDGVELDASVGRKFDRYLVYGKLGAGGFGAVYRARDTRLDYDVALKLLAIDPLDPHRELHVQMFQSEAKALARLSHPNIVKLHDTGVDHGVPFLVMELVGDARTLKSEMEKRVAAHHPIEASEAQHIILHVLAALEAAHAARIIHRDIKPENVMLQSVAGHEHFVRVLDFGLAKFVSDSTRTQRAMGTPRYMAPEQLWGRHLGDWTDLYAVGVMAFELITGRSPFGRIAAEMIARKKDATFDPLAAIGDLALPQAALDFLRRALAYDPADRFQNVAEFRVALNEAYRAIIQTGRVELTSINLGDVIGDDYEAPAPSVRSLATPVATVTPTPTSPRTQTNPPKPPRRWWPWIVGVVIASGGAVAAIVASSSPSGPTSETPTLASHTPDSETPATTTASPNTPPTSAPATTPPTTAPAPTPEELARAERERKQKDAAQKVTQGEAQLEAHPDQAQELAEQALTLDPENAGAKTLAEKAKAKLAALDAQRIAEIRRNRLAQIESAIKEKRWSDARGIIKAVMAANPRDAEGQELGKRVDREEAADLAQRKANGLCVSGRAKLGQKNFDGADADANAALAIVASLPCATTLVSDTKAARDAETARLARESAEAACARGRQKLEAKSFDAAIIEADVALDAVPNIACATSLKSDVKAAREADVARQLAAHEAAARAALEREDWDDAIASADAGLALDPLHAGLKGIKKLAAQEKACADFIAKVEALTTPAARWSKLGSPPTAPAGSRCAARLAELKASVAPEYAADRVSRGRTSLAGNDLDAARDHANAALEAMPGYEPANRLIEAIEKKENEPPPQTMSNYCCIPGAGRFGPFLNQPAQPVGSSCWVALPTGVAYGAVCP